MQRAVATARRVATSDAAVLVTGESGTGKNVLACAIHAWSPRHRGAFVTIPCTTLAEHFLESDGFPGMGAGPPGRLEAARGGTLLLDEASDVPIELQGRLLQALVVLGVGDAMEADARIVTTTKRDLEAEVRAGRFREDLFFRLNVVTIALPPLRERREDLMALTDHILTRLAAHHHRGALRLAPEVRRIFAGYRWPGNVRELANTLERAVVLSQGDTISPEHLPDRLLTPGASANGRETGEHLASLRELERQQIGRVLAESETLDEAATRLGINPSTLWRKRKRYGLE